MINPPPGGKTNGKVQPPVNVGPKVKKIDSTPIGRTGLKASGRYVYEEYENKLIGERGQQIYVRMRDDDATVGAILLAIELLIRQVKWSIQPAGLPADLDQQYQIAQTTLRMEQARIKAQRDAESRALMVANAQNNQVPSNGDKSGPFPKGVTPPHLAPFALPKAAKEPDNQSPDNNTQDNQSPDYMPATKKIDVLNQQPMPTMTTDPRFIGVNSQIEVFKQEAENWAQFIREAFDDMEDSWEDILSEALTFIVFGWSLLEEVYKIRAGETNDPETTSKYEDGLIGWKSWSIRSQESLTGWKFDPNTGKALGMYQMPWPTFYEYYIPLDKALLFRTSTRKGNPEGKSALRNAYRAHYYKRHIEEIEAVGVERDMAGIPIAYAPPDIMLPTASANDKMVYQSLQTMVTGIRQDERAGLVFPLSYDDKGNKRFYFELASAPGTRQFDTSNVINRYKLDIAQSVLADVILLGHEKVGSYALSSSKTELFATALGAWLDMILGVINKDGIQRLCRLNNVPREYWPMMIHDDIELPDLEVLGNYVKNISLAGAAILPSRDGEIEKYLCKAASLPVPADVADEL